MTSRCECEPMKTSETDRLKSKPCPVFDGNLWLTSSHRIRKGESEPQTAFTRHIASYHLVERVANWFPAYLREDGLDLEGDGGHRRPNLSASAQRYLDRLGADVEDLFHHVLAVLHNPAYREANAGALRMDWPRIPIPGWPDGDEDRDAEEMAESAARGRSVHHRRQQHGWRELRSVRRLGTLRVGPCGYAGPGTCCREILYLV